LRTDNPNQTAMKKRRIEIAVFAHNEERNIAACIADITSQEFQPTDSVSIAILCNGCTDATVEVASIAATSSRDAAQVSVVNLSPGGKARTWNWFVSRLSSDTEIVVFVDGDIRLKDKHGIARLLQHLDDRTLVASVSQPVAVFEAPTPRWLRIVFERTKSRLDDGAICGQLYAVRASAIKPIRLPVPCLVEDGFLAACLKTSLFETDAACGIRVARDVSHEYTQLSSLKAFFRHSVRVELGTQMNAALYTLLWRARDREARLQLCEQLSEGLMQEEAFGEYLRQTYSQSIVHRTVYGFFSESWNELRRNPWNAPFSIAKRAYVAVVRARVRRLLHQREFNW
jgi:glycosyltransferase involved in cell wall biosynthesis